MAQSAGLIIRGSWVQIPPGDWIFSLAAQTGHPGGASKLMMCVGGPHSTMDGVFASHPAAPDSILSVPVRIYSLDVVEINRLLSI